MYATSLSVADYMTRGPLVASPKDLLGNARRIMDEYAIRHLPVEAEGKRGRPQRSRMTRCIAFSLKRVRVRSK